MNNKEKEYLFFKSAVGENRDLFKKFVYNPQEVLQKLEVSEETLHPPDKAQEALKRAEEVTRKIEEISIKRKPLTDELPEVTKLIEESFGKDFEVSVEPFGIKFSEAIVETPEMWTATGSVGGTFGGLDNLRPDVDG